MLVVWQVRQPRLEIKKDAKGMVVVPGAVMVEVTSARELLATFEKVRHRLFCGIDILGVGELFVLL